MDDPLFKSKHPAVLRFLAELAKEKEARSAMERMRAELSAPTVAVHVEKDDEIENGQPHIAATQRPGVYYRHGQVGESV
jgi:hypothetical protein